MKIIIENKKNKNDICVLDTAKAIVNKFLAVCNDCGYGMISKGAEIDPILLKEN